MELSWILGTIIFFISFFVLFTIIPRLIFIFLKRIFLFKEEVSFLNNYFRLLLIYFITAIPLTIIFYQASTFGNREILSNAFGENIWATLFLFTIIILGLIRLSLLWKKRECLDKIKWIKTSFGRMSDEDRKKFYQEHFSFLFEVLFAGFFFGLLIWIFKATFLSDFTYLQIPQVYKTLTSVYNSTWSFFKPFLIYSIIIIILTLIIELLIKYKHHKIEIFNDS